MASEATVFVVDDDPAIADSLGVLLRSVGLKVKTYASAEEFLQDYKPSQPGCLLLDVRLPGISGLELQERLATRNVHIPIIMITSYGDVPMSVRALKAGAVQFLQKPFRDQELLDYISEAIRLDARARHERAQRDAIEARLALLTLREHEVLTLVVDGKLNKQIANELRISLRTVETHRARMMEKLHASTAVDLVRMTMIVVADRENRNAPT